MKEQLYTFLPVQMQNLACSYQGAKLKKERMGGKFGHFLKGYLERKNWPFQELKNYQEKRLQSFVKHAYSTVPYYQEQFKELGISPSDIRTLEDLKVLPVLTKDDVRNNEILFLSNQFKKEDLIKISTSGSTGTSLQLYYTSEQLQEQFALWWKYRIDLGIDLNTWCVDFGSRTIVPEKQKAPPFWRISKPLKQVKFSAFHGKEKNFLEYYKEIKRNKLTWIHGYPTIITPFAAFLNENNLSLTDQIKFVTTGGENLYNFQRDQIFRAFGVYPHSHYGLAECVGNFSEDVNHVQTVDEDFAGVEFIPNGENYKIVGTNFGNYAMPLLRYDTGDLALLGNYTNGRREVLHIDGRNGEYLLLKSGTRVGALSALFTETDHIIEAQLYQKRDYTVEIRYVSNALENEINKDLKKVKILLRKRVGNNLDFYFKKFERIPRTTRGKLRYIISDFASQIEINQGGTQSKLIS